MDSSEFVSVEGNIDFVIQQKGEIVRFIEQRRGSHDRSFRFRDTGPRSLSDGRPEATLPFSRTFFPSPLSASPTQDVRESPHTTSTQPRVRDARSDLTIDGI